MMKTLMENIETVNNIYNFRCPQCSKLYQVYKHDLISSSPQFECKSCQAIFALNINLKKASSTAPTSVLTTAQRLRLEEKQKANQIRRSAIQKGELKPCPKCNTLNPRVSQECYKCGIVFAKAEMMNEVQKQGGVPSLMKAWQDLLQDYNNMTKHMAFVDRCEDLQALPFALRKYKELKEVQPQDSTAEKMFNSVIIKFLAKRANVVTAQAWFHKVPWVNLTRVSPLILGILLVLVGVSNAANRNFAGGGVALLALTLGFTYVLKGRIKWQDFWH